MASRVVVGIIGGLFVFVAVMLILGFVLRNIFEGIGPWGTFIGWILPILLGLLAGVASFRKSVWPQNRK